MTHDRTHHAVHLWVDRFAVAVSAEEQVHHLLSEQVVNLLLGAHRHREAIDPEIHRVVCPISGFGCGTVPPAVADSHSA